MSRKLPRNKAVGGVLAAIAAAASIAAPVEASPPGSTYVSPAAAEAFLSKIIKISERTGSDGKFCESNPSGPFAEQCSGIRWSEMKPFTEAPPPEAKKPVAPKRPVGTVKKSYEQNGRKPPNTQPVPDQKKSK